VLARIDDSFNSESEKGPRIVVLRAMGGQGKTQIALEYCRRTRSSTVTVVFWVDASSESALKQSYSSIYEILACQADALLDVDARVNFALRRLRAWRGPWLLVLDNYDNPVEFNNVEDYIPEYKQGMILVTSRHADADGLAKEENRIRLPGLLESEAVELLLSQGKRQKTDQVASSHAKLIVERLGYHPLAIAQAGAYINKRKLPLEEFLDHFQQRKAMILKDTTPQMSQYRRKLEGAEQETSLSVFATWELSYQQLLVEDTEDKCMADLLTLLAFFAAGGVSENLFKAYCDYSKAAKSPSNDTEAPNSPHQSQEPYAIQKVSKGDKHLVPGAFLSLHKQTWDSDLYCDVLATMAHLSLVEGFSRAPDEGYKVALHPLVRDWIRLRTHKSACAEYTYLAATCLHRLLRSGLINNHFAMGFSIGQNLLKHLDAHISNIENLFPQASDVLNESKRARLGKYEVDFGVLWREFGEYAKARDVYRQCLARRNSDIAANDRVTRRHLALLGGVLERLGEYKEAEEIMKKALRIAIEVNGEEHEETIGHMVNLGQVLLAQSLNDEAEEYIRASLRFRERLLGKEDHRTLQSMVDLGRLLAHQQNFREAEKVFRQTLKLLEVALGKEHPYTLITMHNLAEALTSQEEWKEKEDLYRQVLDLEEKLHGREYPGRMQALANLANLMVCMDRYDEAKEMYIQSMTSLEVSLGSNHVLTLGCYGGYGTLFCITGRYEEALPLLQRGYMGFREIFGPQHANTLFHENQLEVLAIELKKKVKNLVNLGRNREAEEIYMQSMKSLEVSLGKSNRSTLCFTTYYGTLLLKTGRYLEALPLLEIVYMRTLELLGPQHADTLRRKQRLEHLLEVIKENNDNIDQKKEDGNVENRFIGVA
jgi:tetratricopeptide (TPR) repeat protein